MKQQLAFILLFVLPYAFIFFRKGKKQNTNQSRGEKITKIINLAFFTLVIIIALLIMKGAM